MSQVLKLYGPPGTGKTRTLLELFEKELVHTPADRIAFLTFTRSAKFEALGRSGKIQEELPYLRTIHSICYRQMSFAQGQMVQTRDVKEFGRSIGIKINHLPIDPWAAEEWEIPEYQPMATQADMLLQLNHRGRHRRIGLKESLQDVNINIDHYFAKWFTDSYRRWKDSEAMYDYTDILTTFLAVGKPLPIDVMFVDEAQDLSVLQWDVIHRLGSEAARWYLAGDDDQAIFQWAGASPERFIKERYDEQQFLDITYRLPRRVFTQAQQVIQKVRARVKKPLRPRDEEGQVREIHAIDTIEKKEFIDTSTFVLFRNHYRGMLLAQEMEAAGIPFDGPHSILARPEVRNVLTAWHKTTTNALWSPAEARAVSALVGVDNLKPEAKNLKEKLIRPDAVLQKMPEGKEWPRLLAKVLKADGINYTLGIVAAHGWDALLHPRTRLMSIHQSKGGQADRVILDVCMLRKSFESLVRDEDSEHRVWYVGITRAKEELLTLMPNDQLVYEL